MIDAMGTLIALQPPAPRLARELDQRFGLEVTAAEAERAIAAEIRYYRSHMNEGRDDRTVAELRRRCAAEMRGALPDLSNVGEQALTDALIASLEFALFDDAREALQAARQHGLRVVVVSNWDSSLAQVLERVGLADVIDGVVSSAAVGAAKPDPGDLRGGAGARATSPPARRCTSATASSTTSPERGPPGSLPCG